MKNLVSAFIFVVCVKTISGDSPCVSRDVEYGRVCVCNSTYCDTVPQVLNLASTEYQLYSTSAENIGFHASTGKFSGNARSTSLSVTVPEINKNGEVIMGFGGAFTDTTSYDILSLSADLQEFLLQSFFGKDGIEYTINRVTMGASDFSLRAYSHCDTKDETLGKFALQDEDLKYKIPLIKKAQAIRGEEFKLFLSSWSSPVWMKTVEDFRGTGVLKDEYQALWAEYYIKFLTAYREQGVEFWGITPQNEPYSSPDWNINLLFTYESLRDWILEHFGPAIRNSSFKDLKIMLLDDTTIHLTSFQNTTLSRKEIYDYADGIAIHWYQNDKNQESWFNFPENLFVLGTEACQNVNGYLSNMMVRLGDWSRGVDYVNDILYDLNHHFNGWIEWNFALSNVGGPSWMNVSLDAPVIISEARDEFYKEPMFYVLGHFSKFLVPDSVKLDITTSDALSAANVKAAAFLRPDDKVAVIISNQSNNPVTVQINIAGAVESIDFEANSLNTLLYNQ
ncbi:lysosomal acid glucosylceramidase-like [Cylas formicarius]|uniref:lysosomal acid glucosylceramidase-like n=1 Tax=Cylas formicarius TaxID=197179 RepID=UPI002958C13E|nr:lysosomal acid glucosylceramidase-like [Cylas formicarius]